MQQYSIYPTDVRVWRSIGTSQTSSTSARRHRYLVYPSGVFVWQSYGAASGVASFSIVPTGGHALGVVPIAATGVSTTWTGSNPFSITVGGGFATLSNYANISGTSATFDLTISSNGGTVTVSDSNSGTTQNYAAVAVVPGTPTIGTATNNHDGTASVSFTPNADNGGAAITTATAYGSLGDNGTSSGSSPITVAVASANRGTNQTWQVTQTNSVGESAHSGSSNAVAVTSPPGPPTSVVSSTSTPTTGSVTGTAPAVTGGLSLTYIADDGLGGHTTTAGAVPRTLTGLSTAVTITPRLQAVNADGSSAFVAGNSITPAATVPDAPTIGTLTDNHDGTITIAFTPPVNDGGATITLYTATTSSGGFNNTGTASPITISGVNLGVSQTVSVKATNSVGQSAASSNSNAITPITVPGPPTSLIATATTIGHATVSFTSPANNGGGAITGYTVSGGGTDSNAGGTGLTHTITGLANATAYTFTAVATNSYGTSVASAPSNLITTLGFTLSPSSVSTTGVKHIVATGYGTTWTGANPFAIVSGPLSTLTNYANVSATSASFDVTVTAISGVQGVISDSNSGTNQTINIGGTGVTTYANITNFSDVTGFTAVTKASGVARSG